jgi:hypothetical protein
MPPDSHDVFSSLNGALSEFSTENFRKLSARIRFRRVNEILLKLIQEAPAEVFLLPAVIDYIDRINKEKVLDETYKFTLFEFWLNHFSELKPDENYFIRAKIMGKFLPREDYQVFFPIGMNKVFRGTHFVVAHLSPDIDTMIASFWGWVDAFAARVSDGLHLWSLPGGPPSSPVVQLFKEILASQVFSSLARTNETLTLAARDLVSHENLIKAPADISISFLDHGYNDKALMLVDEHGHYQGDWRTLDVEPVRQIIILFKSCLHWFENHVHMELISLFSKKDFSAKDIPPFLDKIFDISFETCEPVIDFTPQQRKDLESLLNKILKMPDGLKSTFGELKKSLEAFDLPGLSQFHDEVLRLQVSKLFDAQGSVHEERPTLFAHLKHVLNHLSKAIHKIRDFVERLDIAIQIKMEVLGKIPHYLTLRNEVDDIRLKMGSYDYLTVVAPEEENTLYPIGVVWDSELRKPILGTVTLRDFCNQEEVKMAPYLSIISVIDHHKSTLKTQSPPLALIGDAQSCAVIVAEQTMAINSKYSNAGMSQESIRKQIEELQKSDSPADIRLIQRLLQRQMTFNLQGAYFVHPRREWCEYFCFLHAILDDTDLLSKVSQRDVLCTAQLLNLLETLSQKKEIEVIHLDAIPKDAAFAKEAAKALLRSEALYRIYEPVFSFKEKELESQLEACAQGKSSNIFQDTKEQNGCCRVGQTKLFSSNIPYFTQHEPILVEAWLKQAQEAWTLNPKIDLHIHMVSTIPSADEVYRGLTGHYNHQDEMWIWIPDKEQAQAHLTLFLSAFQTGPEVNNNVMTLEFAGKGIEELAGIFKRNFLPIPQRVNGEWKIDEPIAILRYKAGSLNSRKSMVSPYLPQLM